MIANAASTRRFPVRARGVLALCVAITSTACGTGDDSTGDPQALIVTGHCAVTAMGVMPGGEGVTGSIHDDGTGTPTGTWQSGTATASLVGTPDWLECRVNGSTVADFTGTGSWNGAPGYSYRVHVQDRGTSGEPVRVEGAPTTATLTATHTYSPSRSTDGSASWDAGAYATIPASLPVTVGNAGNGWAWITFASEPDATASLGYDVRCRYRGGARASSGCRGRDLEAGESYAFVDCQRPCGSVPDDDDDDDRDGHFDEHHRWHGRHGGYEHGGHFYARGDDHHRCGRDDDDGAHDTWCTDPALLAGAQILVSSATLHVDSGATDLPSRRHAQTTVVVALDVTPFTWSTPENDFYRLAVWDPSGALVHSADGDLSSGDITVTLLP